MTAPPGTPGTGVRSGSRETLPLRPTPAQTRALLGGGVAALLAVLSGRPDILLIALPLLVWSLLAHTARLRSSTPSPATTGDLLDRSGETGALSPVLWASTDRIHEGRTLHARVIASPDVLVGAVLPPRSHVRTTPRFGAILDRGGATLEVTAHRWGTYSLGPVLVQVTDPSGAFRGRQSISPISVQVTPSSSVLDAPVDVPTVTGVSGAHISKRRGPGTALADVRTFQPGDRLHRINWRVTSRTGVMHTNATFTEQDTDVLLVTDTLADVVPGDSAPVDSPSSLDVTVRASAAVARHYLGLGDRVALHDLGSLIGRVPPGAGPRHLRVLTDALARARREANGSRVALLRTVRSGTLTVVFSPLLSDQIIEQIGILVSHGADVIVVDTLPRSIGDASALTGRPERGIDGRPSPRFWAEAWTMRRLLRERTVRELREKGVPVTPWEGPASLAPVVLSLMAAGSAPRMRRP